MRRLLLRCALILLVGIGPAAGTASAAGTRSFQDDTGRTVPVPDRVERVFGAGGPAAILLYTLAPERMLGWPRENAGEVKAFLAEPYAALPATGQLTGRAATASPEAVVALAPDLILDSGSTGATYADLAERVQRQTGIPYVVLTGDFAATPATYRRLGALLGLEARAGDLAAWAEGMIAEIDRRLASLPPERRVRVYYGRGPDGLETGLAGSINTEVLERVGAVNVAVSAGAGGLAQVSLEQVLAWAPDAIVTTDAAFYDLARHDPRWAGLRAVREGRVHLAPRLPFPWVDFPPGVNRLIGARWLVSVLYPDLFPEDIRPVVRDFFERFYHRSLSDAELAGLLTPPGGDGAGR
ncbi:iron ABC transporter substrate-binding protein [Rhodospirillum centenum]|uniref:Iron(III) ABC transporter, periplasmic iron-binding protein, putative n=1 Tax=Rhodospirillum centenum (strain ATCC 51521 / SW) TaxID=414684 RepID=B6IXQ8_RHOCS|nr:iron ABC transporter substrate-binding protein [Rhodospirillum centenum]ACJ01082.1 iron(III) ABC transporter, periplasmic iron-binding protein, putative [Rhodospirillum centenum SW]